jgi:hypothetical protein
MKSYALKLFFESSPKHKKATKAHRRMLNNQRNARTGKQKYVLLPVLPMHTIPKPAATI